MGFQHAGAATITVNTADNAGMADDGFCTFTEAVVAANTNTESGPTPGECAAGEPGPVKDLITFDLGIFPADVFLFDTLELNESVRIEGPGAGVMSVTNLAETRVFNILNFQVDAEFEISGMTLRDNLLRPVTGDYGGAIQASLASGSSLLLENMVFLDNGSERGGGAIGLFGGNDNSITIRNCTFENNYAGNFGDGNVVGGGAIFVGAGQNVLIENSSFVGNSTFHPALVQPQDDAAGGAVLIRSAQGFTSTVDIFESTFSGNSATGVGGAIALGGPGFPSDISELSVRHSTIVLNTADQNDDQAALPGGGGIWSASSEPVDLFNSIVALNVDNADSPAPDLHGNMASFGFNLIGDNNTVGSAFPAGQPNANDDRVGTGTAPLDPALEVLAHAGGPTPVHVPTLASPAIDQGQCSTRTTDQRLFQNAQTGFRIVDIANLPNASEGCDIGAVELFSASENPIPDAIDDNYIALEDQPLIVPAAEGLLQNDVDDDPLVVIDVTEVGSNRMPLSGEVTATADGAFVFEALRPDASGTAEFVYTVTDALNTDSATLSIEVLPVNDPPRYVAAVDRLTAAPGQPFVFEDWATEIGAGPADEQGQSLAFIVSPVNVPGGFFASVPDIDLGSDSGADLRFEIAPGAAGSARVSVVLRDSGGTANGGTNQTEPLILTIESDALEIFSDGFESSAPGAGS